MNAQGIALAYTRAEQDLHSLCISIAPHNSGLMEYEPGRERDTVPGAQLIQTDKPFPTRTHLGFF